MRKLEILGEENKYNYCMQDRPTTNELSDAVRTFLETEILPITTDARLKFRLLVAMNALTMISRETNLEESNLEAEFSSLQALLNSNQATPTSFSSLRAATLEMNAELASQIRAGVLPNGVFEHLETITKAKLTISNPSYLKRYE